MQKIYERSATNRSAFTLIEILIVIAIIAILASLILAGVVAVRNRIPVATTQNDILQLSTAMNAFYSKYKFYPPNRFRLCSSRTRYTTNPSPNTEPQLDPQSIAAISTMFPNINWTAIAWDGANTNIYTILEGDQCLVFFLGGIPNGNGKPPLGFSTNPANPAAAATAADPDRIKWMNSFDGSRIMILTHPVADRSTGTFPSYLDGFAANLPAAGNPAGTKQKQPYLYFSSMSLVKRENGYDPTASSPLNISVSPYSQVPASNPIKYWNSSTFQIISAGPDGSFGIGGAWPPAGNHGMDDYSNFNTSVLGAPD